MSQLEKRIRRLEDTHTPGVVYVVHHRPGESGEQAIDRYRTEEIRLASKIMLAPEICKTTEEWQKRYALDEDAP